MYHINMSADWGYGQMGAPSSPRYLLSLQINLGIINLGIVVPSLLK